MKKVIDELSKHLKDTGLTAKQVLSTYWNVKDQNNEAFEEDALSFNVACRMDDLGLLLKNKTIGDYEVIGCDLYYKSELVLKNPPDGVLYPVTEGQAKHLIVVVNYIVEHNLISDSWDKFF